METTTSDNGYNPGEGTRRSRFRIVAPAYPSFNIYSSIARVTTALGPVIIATVVNKMDGWDAEVIDENNYRRLGPCDVMGRPDYDALQRIRPANVIGFYGGLTSTIPRLYELATHFKKCGRIESIRAAGSDGSTTMGISLCSSPTLR